MNVVLSLPLSERIMYRIPLWLPEKGSFFKPL
ncbi:hypothetical protein RUMTOR_00267 [[Ruminococcus] torques ATCC 27756]|uniref:Uncharacterized protein n=1 Tax=[Ruminococcus] torques ATCC 27756 TaxID=411460 RepID=A5KJ71_9FIRM|nr:hypothetical protein RUMTOR_00267 [[Ruminococcus] torques ATCC 27756]